jgi:endonuclease III
VARKTTKAGGKSVQIKPGGHSAPGLSGRDLAQSPKPGGRPAPKSTRRESRRARAERAAEIVSRLAAEYPDHRIALDFQTPLQLLVATILAAQCTDQRVNAVTPELFARLPTARDLGAAPLPLLEEMVHPTGFFRNKARAVKALGQALVADHNGEVPADMEALVRLPGVGRKTANVVLGNAFGQAAGVVVDTHVTRLANRLGLTRESDPVKIEADLQQVLPRERWIDAANLLIHHGRAVCKARRPECGRCVVNALCPSAEI